MLGKALASSSKIVFEDGKVKLIRECGFRLKQVTMALKNFNIRHFSFNFLIFFRLQWFRLIVLILIIVS